RVDALPALLGPVVVFEIEPQRELVEREGRAAAVGDRGDPRGLALLVRADLQQPQVADGQQTRDAEGQVVNVAAAGGDVPKRSAVGPDRVRDGAHRREGDEEGPGGEQLALLAPIAE